MEWIEQFYTEQFKMSYMEKNELKIQNYHVEQLEKLEKHANKPIKKLLELGAGKGELEF